MLRPTVPDDIERASKSGPIRGRPRPRVGDDPARHREYDQLVRRSRRGVPATDCLPAGDYPRHRLIGVCDVFDCPGQGEIGYWLDRAVRGRGSAWRLQNGCPVAIDDVGLTSCWLVRGRQRRVGGDPHAAWVHPAGGHSDLRHPAGEITQRRFLLTSDRRACIRVRYGCTLDACRLKALAQADRTHGDSHEACRHPERRRAPCHARLCCRAAMRPMSASGIARSASSCSPARPTATPAARRCRRRSSVEVEGNNYIMTFATDTRSACRARRHDHAVALDRIRRHVRLHAAQLLAGLVSSRPRRLRWA